MQLDRLGNPKKHLYGNTSQKYYFFNVSYGMTECRNVQGHSANDRLYTFRSTRPPNLVFCTRLVSQLAFSLPPDISQNPRLRCLRRNGLMRGRRICVMGYRVRNYHRRGRVVLGADRFFRLCPLDFKIEASRGRRAEWTLHHIIRHWVSHVAAPNVVQTLWFLVRREARDVCRPTLRANATSTLSYSWLC